MARRIVGWDVGGAHLKAAMLSADGHLKQVIQVPCALWRGMPELTRAIQSVIHTFNIENTTEIMHAITMTGELVDLFANRQEGVLAISQHMQTQLIGDKYFYTGAQKADFSGFAKIKEVQQCWQSIASANWLATAANTAKRLKHCSDFSNGILIDIGSTTSDFIVLKEGEPQSQGLSDAERMQNDELVYTGVVRTPLMALTQKIMFRNQSTSVAAEYFATTADVYRLTAELNEIDDMTDTADGQDKTLFASSRRLARMIGRDVEEAGLEEWKRLALAFKAKQFSRLTEALEKHLTAIRYYSAHITILGAGVGHFLAEQLATEYNLPYRNAASLLHEHSNMTNMFMTSTCLPAAAVACLAHEALSEHSMIRAQS